MKNIAYFKKKALKNISDGVNFRDIFKKLNFEWYVLGGSCYHGNKHVMKCLEGNFNMSVIRQFIISFS